MTIKPWPLKLGIATLVISIFPWSYWVYGIGKILICAIALYYAYCNYKKSEKQNKIFWYFLIVAIIFNPLLPIHLFFSIFWIIVDIGVIIFFWSYLKDINYHLINHLTIESNPTKSMLTNKFPITEQVRNHMEFLGYKIELFEDEKADVLVATSDNHSNIMVRVIDDFILISARYRTAIKSKAESIELFRLFDKINSEAVVSRWYSNLQNDGAITLVIEAYIFGYDKTQFGKLVDKFEVDIRFYMGRFMELEDKAESKI